MNRLHALSVGTHAETGRFSGVVHSVFSRACNLALDDERLLCVIASEHGNAPNAVCVDAPPRFAFDHSVSPGDRAGCRAGVLRIGASAIEVRLHDVPRWHTRLDNIDTDLSQPEVRTAWWVVRRCLSRHGTMRSYPGSDVLLKRLKDLYHAARQCNVAQGRAAVDALVGVGPGLTPAGDDMLVGFLAGLYATGDKHEALTKFIHEIELSVRNAAIHTNRVSAEYLRLATHGAFAEPLADLVITIARGEIPDVVKPIADRALAVGASSGCDGVRAMLIALAAGCRERRTGDVVQ
ncbi:MAG: hypothetical protein DHS20C01_34370 [marine bacterium B5-7]|nr:MAG: hypothetical protein DHS20C01_34370 [marine bacterium B5-7]